MVDDKLIDRLERKKDRQRMKNKNKSQANSAFGGVMDKYTHINLNKLKTKGVIKDFVGIISSGKEANVYFAYGQDNFPLAVKIYKIDPQNTKWMKNYIIGDPRFYKIGSSTHKIIYTWCKKEYKNLKQFYRKEIPVPNPIDYRSNILVMEYIGEKDGTPAPRLKDINKFTDPLLEMNIILNNIEKMYIDAKLVHGDLSEFNILYHQNHQIIIDVSQAVSTSHIHAPIFLKRDVKNIVNFFSKFISSPYLPKIDDIVKNILEKQA